MLLCQCFEFMSRQQFEHLSQHSARMSHGLISPVCSVVYGQFNCTKQVEIRPSYSAVYGTAVPASRPHLLRPAPPRKQTEEHRLSELTPSGFRPASRKPIYPPPNASFSATCLLRPDCV